MKLPLDEKKEEEVEEYTEIPIDMEEAAGTKVFVEALDGIADVDRLLRKVKEGNIVIAGIKKIKESNMDELRHCISKIKTICAGLEGDVAGVGDEWLIITPNKARIQRE